MNDLSSAPPSTSVITRRSAAELASSAGIAGPRGRVLVVHPSSDQATTLVSSIRDMWNDLDVRSERNLVDATETAAAFAPSVVLLDAQLLDSVSDTIAKEFGTHGARVVVLADTLTGELVAAAISAGCEGVAFSQATAEAFLGADASAPAVPAATNPLTRRQREVLDLITEGLSTPEIATRLYISRNTARNHVRQVLERLGAHSKLAAVTTAVRMGLVEIR